MREPSFLTDHATSRFINKLMTAYCVLSGVYFMLSESMILARRFRFFPLFFTRIPLRLLGKGDVLSGLWPAVSLRVWGMEFGVSVVRHGNRSNIPVLLWAEQYGTNYHQSTCLFLFWAEIIVNTVSLSIYYMSLRRDEGLLGQNGSNGISKSLP